ncbi:hypothetical protein JB92DRAFT_3114807 [Gautieria morchelliformis]|nr:hypothetical protein JB92DRAFT_3114807 [Gautieria morchelliformis]
MSSPAIKLVALPSFYRDLLDFPTMSNVDPDLLHFSGLSQSRPASEAKLRETLKYHDPAPSNSSNSQPYEASPPLKCTIDPEDLQLATATPPSQPPPAWFRPQHRRWDTYYMADPLIISDTDTPNTFEGYMGRSFHNAAVKHMCYARFKGPELPMESHPNELIILIYREDENSRGDSRACSYLWCA